ncbi:hypothetical protein NPIL_177601 [Nephila pilipes]|uniref:Uncharacterized protein n=1 Tax=Nephila pilipes TaxID=299642 RepID=A0A8X6TPV0_NEPPI|nr:hypothetical protein NPIL_177601 [Nephila pilipes]
MAPAMLHGCDMLPLGMCLCSILPHSTSILFVPFLVMIRVSAFCYIRCAGLAYLPNEHFLPSSTCRFYLYGSYVFCAGAAVRFLYSTAGVAFLLCHVCLLLYCFSFLICMFSVLPAVLWRMHMVLCSIALFVWAWALGVAGVAWATWRSCWRDWRLATYLAFPLLSSL